MAPLEGGRMLARSAVPSAKTMARFISWLSQHGGIVPAVRRRSERTLTLAEREEISRGIASGSSIRETARNLQRAASTVSRRWRATEGVHDIELYVPIIRPGLVCGPGLACLPSHKQLRTIVARKLILNWSPEQIFGWLKRRYPPTRACACPTKPSTVASIQGSRSAEERVGSAPAVRAADATPVHARAGGKSHGQIVDATYPGETCRS